MATETCALDDEIEWFLDHLRVERGASAHTQNAYARDLLLCREILVKQGVESAREIEPGHLLALETSLGQSVARKTVVRRLSALRSFLKFLKRNGEGPKADLPTTGGFRLPKSLPKALAPEVLAKLMDVPDLGKPAGFRDRVLLELLFGAGLRVSEASSLRMDAVDLDSGTLRVTGKREKTRIVPLPEETTMWVRRYLADIRPALLKKPSSNLLIADKGGPLRRETIYAKVSHFARLAGIEKAVGPHVLRHSYAVSLLKGGADLRAVQELLGHESIATTQVYTQLDFAEVTDRYRKAHPRD